MKVVSLAGGVGGAKLCDGLASALPPADLTVIVNTGDDFDHLGLRICPDLDTVCYTLAGFANPATGWGRARETWNALESLAELGGPDWFRVGDKDLATHLERTRLLGKDYTLSRVVKRFCRAWGIKPRVLPMSDDRVATLVYSDEGILEFQDYFVRRQCRPRVSGFQFLGMEQARPAVGVIEAIQGADLVVVCPSNPWVSIDPILSVPEIKPALIGRQVIAVSPLIAGQAIKGPAAKMCSELGLSPSSLTVAKHYGAQPEGGILTGFILDHMDAGEQDRILELGIQVSVVDTLMKTPSDRVRLANQALAFGERLLTAKEV